MSEGGQAPVDPAISPQAPISEAHGLECVTGDVTAVTSATAPASVGAPGPGASTAGSPDASPSLVQEPSPVASDVTATASDVTVTASDATPAPVRASGPGASALGATAGTAAGVAAPPLLVPGSSLPAAAAGGGKEEGGVVGPSIAEQASAAVPVRASALVSWKVDFGRRCFRCYRMSV